jgi:hypothetical protein
MECGRESPGTEREPPGPLGIDPDLSNYETKPSRRFLRWVRAPRAAEGRPAGREVGAVPAPYQGGPWGPLTWIRLRLLAWAGRPRDPRGRGRRPRGWPGLRDEPALGEGRAAGSGPVHLLGRLDPLRGGARAGVLGELCDPPRDLGLVGVPFRPACQLRTELGGVGARPVDQVQGRAAGAHVADGDPEPLVAAVIRRGPYSVLH